MVGAPGSGKSTQVSKLVSLHPGAIVISGDDIRAELYGDANIQGNYSEILDRMLKILGASVGRVVILDGTHYRSSYRKLALDMLFSYGYKDVTAVVVDRPLGVCLEQNAGRDRKVPEFVIQKMHMALQASIRRIHGEGFTQVMFV